MLKEVLIIFIIDNGNSKEIIYPNRSKIQPCGKHYRNRECQTSRRDINTNYPVKIRFVPKQFNHSGNFLSDQGLVNGSNGSHMVLNTLTLRNSLIKIFHISCL